MPRFEVTFCDDKEIVKEAQTADDAKRQAKAERARDLPHDTPRSAPEIKVAKVARLD